MHATLIAEDFAGMWSQGRGLSERAGFSWEQQAITMRRHDIWCHFPARFWPSPLKRIEPFKISTKTNVIISIGGRGAVIGAALGKKYNIPIIQVQNPRMNLKHYNFVIANFHDNLIGNNVFSTRTALHGITENVLKRSRIRWESTICSEGKKVLGVLLGGSNGRFRFGSAEAYKIAQQLSDFIKDHHVSCVITPSRRTSLSSLRILKEKLEPLGARILEGEGDNNPYMGILSCSDILAVTTDSVSMISEAVATSLPVGILPLSGHSSRIKQFVNMLIQEGRVQPFSSNIVIKEMERLDDTYLAAETIRHCIMFS